MATARRSLPPSRGAGPSLPAAPSFRQRCPYIAACLMAHLEMRLEVVALSHGRRFQAGVGAGWLHLFCCLSASACCDGAYNIDAQQQNLKDHILHLADVCMLRAAQGRASQHNPLISSYRSLPDLRVRNRSRPGCKHGSALRAPFASGSWGQREQQRGRGRMGGRRQRGGAGMERPHRWRSVQVSRRCHPHIPSPRLSTIPISFYCHCCIATFAPLPTLVVAEC